MYSIEATTSSSQKVKVVIVKAVHPISGTFKSTPVNFGLLGNVAEVQYSEKEVYLVYLFHTPLKIILFIST
jgi:hypothetical protein